MNNHIYDSEDSQHLDGLPHKYHRLEQCQIGLGWSTYAQDLANEQQALQQLYAELIDQADAECESNDGQFAGLPVRFHDSERWQAGEGWREYQAEQATEHAYLQTKYADAFDAENAASDDGAAE